MALSLSPSQRLSAAIMRVVEPPIAIAPYFGAILRGLVRREMTPEMEAALEAFGQKPTLAVSADGILMWSPQFVSSIDITELAWSLIHEVGHVVLKHCARAEAQGIPRMHAKTADDMTNARIWNLAADATWNEELRKMNPAKLPDWWVMPETLEQPPGLIVEERYRLLRQKVSEMPKPGAGSGSCGSCSGNPLPGEPESGKSEDGRSEADMARFRKQVAMDIQSTKLRGSIPASLQRWADEFLAPPKIDWRTKLARLVRGAVAYRSGQSDFTWSRMSRRQAGVGYGLGRPVIPALHSPKPNVACALDVSGSMGPDLLASALSEVQGVLSAVGAQITFVVCDAKVHGIKSVKSMDEAKLMMVGGGGTELEPAIKAVAKLKEKPSILIMLTDGYCDDPPNHGLDLIWVIVGGNPGFTATHGETVHVDDNGVDSEAA